MISKDDLAEKNEARIAELQSQLDAARGDSGPNPVVEWKGWKVELDFGEEGDDD